MRFSSPGQTRRRLTEKRILAGRLTEKRSLWLRRDGKAQSGPRPQGTPHGKAHSARWASRKKRTLLAWSSQNASFRDVKPQNVPFRRVRFFSPAQTWRRLTEKRILAGQLTEKRILAGYLTEKRSLARAPRAHLTEKRILHMTAHSPPPSGTVELCKPGDRPRALPLRTPAPRPRRHARPRPSPALPCDLRTHQCPLARSAARTRAPQPRPTYARKETDHEGIRATA